MASSTKETIKNAIPLTIDKGLWMPKQRESIQKINIKAIH